MRARRVWYCCWIAEGRPSAARCMPVRASSAEAWRTPLGAGAGAPVGAAGGRTGSGAVGRAGATGAAAPVDAGGASASCC